MRCGLATRARLDRSRAWITAFLQTVFLFASHLALVFSPSRAIRSPSPSAAFVPWMLMLDHRAAQHAGGHRLPRDLAVGADLRPRAADPGRRRDTGGGLFGPNVERAYWYMLASLLILALASRLSLGRIPRRRRSCAPRTIAGRSRDLVIVYVASIGRRLVARVAGMSARPGPADAARCGISRSLALFLLFTYVMLTGMAGKFLIVRRAVRGDHRASRASSPTSRRVHLAGHRRPSRRASPGRSPSVPASVGRWLACSSPSPCSGRASKASIDSIATGSDESQAISCLARERWDISATARIHAELDRLERASYALLIRFAYVDIFGSVITCRRPRRSRHTMRQWRRGHGPRAAAAVPVPRQGRRCRTPKSTCGSPRAIPTEEVRKGTSISVGYMAENFADLGFPGMLVGHRSCWA